MTLIRLIQRAIILSGLTFAGLPVYGNPVRTDMSDFCIITSNGKTACGKPKSIERACITTSIGSTACGKFKPPSQEEIQGTSRPTSKPVQEVRTTALVRKEVENVVYTLKGCIKSDAIVKCELGMTNKGKEKRLYMSSGDFIDTNGKSNPFYAGEIAGISAGNAATITPGVDYSASITFNNVSEQIVKAQILNVKFNDNFIVVPFRNVPFQIN